MLRRSERARIPRNGSEIILRRQRSISATVSGGLFTIIENGSSNWKRARWFSKVLSITAPFVMHSRVTGYGAWRYDHVPIGYANSDNRTTQWNLWTSTSIYTSTSLHSMGAISFVNSQSWTGTDCNTFYEFEAKYMPMEVASFLELV